MGRRTSRIERRKGSLPLFRIHFEGHDDVAELHQEVALRNHLVQGRDLDEQEWSRIVTEDQTQRCHEAAWRLLNHRPRAAGELKQSLRQRKFPSAIAEQVVTSLIEKGFLNDERFAQQLVTERKRRLDGPRRIKQELKKRGLSEEIMAEVAEDLGSREEQLESASELLLKWNKRSKPTDLSKRRQSAAAFLARRGYGGEVVWQAVKDVISAPQDDEDFPEY